MIIKRVSVTDSNGKSHPTQIYEINGKPLRVRFTHHTGPHLYLVDRNINARINGKADWTLRPDLDTYEFITKKFDFLVPSFAKYKDPVTGEMKIKTGVKGTRAFLGSPEAVKSSLRDFRDNYEIWKRRNITQKDLRGHILASRVTECLIYDEKEWQRDPPKYVARDDANGVKQRVCLDEGTRPQPIARGISACAYGEFYERKRGNVKALGRAFQHYKHKFGVVRTSGKEAVIIASDTVKQALAGKTDQEILDLLSAAGK